MYPEEKRSRTVRVGTYTLLTAPLKLKKEKPGPKWTRFFFYFLCAPDTSGAQRQAGKESLPMQKPAPFRKYSSLSSRQSEVPVGPALARRL